MGSLYENITAACKNRGVSPSAMCLALGMSKSTLSDLKANRKRSLSTDTLSKIASYLEVSSDSLLSRSEKTPDKSKGEDDPPSKSDRISFDDFTYAMYHQTKELTEDNKQKLLEMAQFFKEQQDKAKKEGI